MCGIVGLLSKKSGGLFHEDLEIFQGMLTVDSLRGEDSTGAFTVTRSGDVHSIKIASNPFHLYACEDWQKYRQKSTADGLLLIGHNRKATQGAINSKNAHPFIEDHIVLVHNGTLNNHQSMKTGKEVDSHAICHAFAQKGHEEVIPTLEGAFALVWYDLEKQRLFFVRNDQRPLTITETENGLIALASEAWMPYGQFMRKNIKVKTSEQTDVGVLYEYNPKSGELAQKEIELHKPKTYWPKHNYTPTGTDYDDGVPVGQRSGPYRAPFRDSAALAVGDIVQAKIDRITMEVNPFRQGTQQPKMYGRLLRLGKPDIDCVGWLPMNYKATDAPDWMEGFVCGEVERMVSSNCGMSVWLKSLEIDDTIVCYEGEVGAWTWSKHIAGKPCTKCKGIIDYRDSVFTSVNDKNTNYRVHCHSCITNSLKEGEQRNAFIQRRIAAVQARESVSQKSGGASNDSLIILPNPQTTH